jgi:hypothetical protein
MITQKKAVSSLFLKKSKKRALGSYFGAKYVDCFGLQDAQPKLWLPCMKASILKGILKGLCSISRQSAGPFKEIPADSRVFEGSMLIRQPKRWPVRRKESRIKAFL